MKTLLTLSALLAHMLMAVLIGGVVVFALMPEHPALRQILKACGV